MTINITKNRTAQNTTKNNTETKHTDHSYNTGSCIAYLNCLPPRAAGVNYWIFLLARLVVGVGIMRNVRCCSAGKTAKWMCKIVDFTRNCKNRNSATCFMTDSNGSYHGLSPSFFEEMTRCRRQKHCRRRPDNPSGSSNFRKYRVYLPLLRLFTSARSRLFFRCWWQRQLPRTRTVVFRRDDTWPTSKNFTGDDQATLTVNKNSAKFVYVYTIATDAPVAAPRLMTAFRDRSNST